MSDRNDIRIIQFRDDAMRAHEERCIRDAIGADAPLRFTDALVESVPPDAFLDDRAVILGGSGRYYVSRGTPDALPAVEEACRRARAAGIPMLGICYGAHLLTRAFGGSVSHLPERSELGSVRVRGTAAAGSDRLFGGLPGEYWAQMGHKDFMTALPAGAIVLAENAAAPCQAWSFADERIWAVQFHPELTKASLTERALYYLDEYAGNDRAALERIIRTAEESPEAASLLPRFLALV